MPTNTNTSTETPEAESATDAREELKDALQKAIDEKLAAKRKPDGEISHADRRSAREEARAELRREIEERHFYPARDPRPTYIASPQEARERAESENKIDEELKVAGVSKEESFVDTIKDYSASTVEAVFGDEYTKDWSENKKLGVAAATTLGATALVALGTWLWKRGGTSVDAGQQAAAKAEGGWFKKIMIGAGVGLAAFVGYKGYQKYQEVGDLMKTGKALLEDGKKVIRDTADGARRYIDEKTKDEKEKVEQKVDAAKQKIEDAKNSEAGKEVEKGAKEFFDRKKAGLLFEFFGDIANGVGISDDEIFDNNQVEELCNALEKSKNWTIKDLRGTSDSILQKLFGSIGNGEGQRDKKFDEKRKKAILFLQKILELNSAMLQTKYDKASKAHPEKYAKDFQSMQLKDIFPLLIEENFGEATEFFSEIGDEFLNVIWGKSNIQAALNKWVEKAKNAAINIADYEWELLFPALDERAVDREKVIKEFNNTQKLSELSFDNKLNEAEKKCCQDLRQKLQNRFQKNYLDPYIQDAVFNDPKIIAAMQLRMPYLTTRQAIQMHLLCENGNKISLIPHILSLLENNPDDYGYASGIFAQKLSGNIVDIGKKNIQEISPWIYELIASGDLPPEMERIQKIVLRRMRHKIKDGYKATISFFSSIDLEDGAFYGATTIVAGSAAMTGFEKVMEGVFYKGRDIDILIRRANAGLPILKKWKNISAVWAPEMRDLLEELELFRSQAKMIRSSIAKLSTIGANSGTQTKITEAFLNFIHSNQDDAAIQQFKNLLQSEIVNQPNLTNTLRSIESSFENIVPLKRAMKYAIEGRPLRTMKDIRAVFSWVDVTNTDTKIFGLLAEKILSKLQKQGILKATDTAENATQLIQDFFKAAGRTPTTQEIACIKNSPKAIKQLIEGIKNHATIAGPITPDVANKILNTANKATKIKAGFNSLGFGLDIYSFVVMQEELEELDKKIAANNSSPELQKTLIRQRDETSLQRLLPILSVTGQVTVTLAALKSGAGLYASLGAGGSLLGPIGIAVAAGTYTLEQAHAVEQSMSQEFGDYIKKSNEELLTELGVHPNGRSWGQIVGSALLDSSIFEGSNEYHRSQIIRAYIANNIALTPLDGESPEEYTVRNKEVVSATILSLSRQKSPDGTFINLSPENLRDAKLDGELTIYSQKLQEEEEGDEMTAEEKTFVMVKGTDGAEHKCFLSDYANLVDAEDGKSTVAGVQKPFSRKDVRNAFQANREEAQIDMLFESKMTPDQLRQAMTGKLLGECTDDIHFISHGFMSFDYSGLLGWDEEMKNACLNLAERKIASIILGEVQAYCDDRTEENFVDLYKETLKSIRNRMKQVSPESLNEELNQLKQQNIFDAFKMRDLGKMPITPESIAQRMNEKEGKKVAEKKEAEGGEKSIFTIEELKKQRVVEKKGDMYVKDAKGYRFVRVVNNSILCTEENDVIITSDDPEKIPHGTYAIFRPTETPNRNEPGTLGKFSFRNAYSDEERGVREATLNHRLKQGTLRMQAAGAQKISQYCYSITKGIEGQVVYYFDRSRLEWNITTIDSDLAYNPQYVEQYAASYNQLPKGADPTKIFAKSHLDTARAMQDINQQKPTIPKKAPEPSPKNPPITQPPPVVSA